MNGNGLQLFPHGKEYIEGIYTKGTVDANCSLYSFEAPEYVVSMLGYHLASVGVHWLSFTLSQ